jgi:hypothetical protein
MTLTSLQALTWGTITGAVVSALLLASGESGLPDWSRLRRGDTLTRPPIPTQTNDTATLRSPPAARAMPVSETVPARALDGR